MLTITGGTRWYRYSEFMVGSQYANAGCNDIPNGTCFATPIDLSDHSAVYTGFKSRGNLTWHITPDTMAYYTFSQGYRPGAFNRTEAGEVKIWVDTATGVALPNGVAKTAADSQARQFNKPLSYGPDSLTNNEIGIKSEFLQHRLLVNASAYSMNWQNVQTLIYNPPVYGNTTFGLTGPAIG